MTEMLNGLRMPTINYNAEGGGNTAPAPAGGQPDPAPQPTPAGSPDPKPPTLPNDPPSDDPKPAPAAEASPWGEIDDELKEFAGEKTPAEVLKELKGAQSLLGKKQVGIPDEKSTPEEWAKFHETRGVPKESDDYDFAGVKDDLLKDVPEDQREGMWDEGEERRFKEFAKASNLSQTEAKNLLQRELSHRFEAGKAAAAESAAVSKAAKDMITENWGNREEEYTQDANNFARHMGLGDDVLANIQKMAGTAEARFKTVDFMRQQGALLREGGQPGKTRPGAVPAGSMTADQARMAKSDYLAQGDNQKAYMDSNHPNHKAVTDQVTAYLKAERGI